MVLDLVDARHQQLSVAGKRQTGESAGVAPLVDGFGGFVFVDDSVATEGCIIVAGAVHGEYVDNGDIAWFGGEHNVFVIWNMLVGDGMALFYRGVFALEMAAWQGFGGAGFEVGRVEIGDRRG